MTQPDTVPAWVLAEVGRLHLHALALERALAERQDDGEEQ